MVKSMNFAEPEARPVLGPAGNKARSVELRKPLVKPKIENAQKPPAAGEVKGNRSPAALKSPEMTVAKIPSPVGSRKNAGGAASILRQRQPNLSLNASCSSDASTESSHSRASTGRIIRRTANSAPTLKRKPQCSPKEEKFEMMEGYGKSVGSESDDASLDGSVIKKRCAWVTSNTGTLLHVLLGVVKISRYRCTICEDVQFPVFSVDIRISICGVNGATCIWLTMLKIYQLFGCLLFCELEMELHLYFVSWYWDL